MVPVLEITRLLNIAPPTEILGIVVYPVPGNVILMVTILPELSLVA
jgi:hypothetical protein